MHNMHTIHIHDACCMTGHYMAIMHALSQFQLTSSNTSCIVVSVILSSPHYVKQYKLLHMHSIDSVISIPTYIKQCKLYSSTCIHACACITFIMCMMCMIYNDNYYIHYIIITYIIINCLMKVPGNIHNS